MDKREALCSQLVTMAEYAQHTAQHTSRTTFIAIGASCIVFYVLGYAFYNLYLSPLAKVPGPRLAALTAWYATYLDVFCKGGGQVAMRLGPWHEKYGPIVRIAPGEVHIHDVDFYEILYSTRSKYSKLPAWRWRFGLWHSTFDTVDHDHHHIRRQPLASFFSQLKVQDFSPQLQRMTDRMVDTLLREYKGTGRVVSLTWAWSAVAMDAVTYYTFARNYDATGYPGFEAPFMISMNNLISSLHTMENFPWLLFLLKALPNWLAEVLSPDMKSVFDWHKDSEIQIKKIINGEAKEDVEKVSHKTVFHEILNSNMPPQELALDRLKHDAAGILGGGVETSKTALSVTCYYILSDPKILSELEKELSEAIPDASQMPPLSKLENLPYLTAVYKEGLRISTGIAQRLARKNPYGPIVYGKYVLPPNTTFGMSSGLQLRDPRIYPQPEVFDPQRWLGPDQPSDKIFVPYGRGPRMCLGMHMARAELYIGLATIFRRVQGMKLYDTGPEAVDMACEYVVPLPKEGTKGVRITID